MTLNDLSSEQQEFVHLALSGKNVLCDACIGSGKTSTINVLCDAYPPERRILYLTYNRLLKLDAKDKIKNHNVLVQNYHGFASLLLNKKRIRNCGQGEQLAMVLEKKIPIPPIDTLIIDEYQDINEMGEYFLFLNHLTCSMASPLNNRCFYGANTTNEWVVREYIKDKENNPTIYNGLPLHTEYRVFVDFDTKEILGASPYWRSDVMKNEFKKVSSPQERHDYVVYKMHEDILNQRYHESVQTVLAELKKVIPRIELTGQWSVDVMRNGNDYYIIDMALAENSALNDCVPKNLLRAYPQQWLPGESNS